MYIFEIEKTLQALYYLREGVLRASWMGLRICTYGLGRCGGNWLVALLGMVEGIAPYQVRGRLASPQ